RSLLLMSRDHPIHLLLPRRRLLVSVTQAWSMVPNFPRTMFPGMTKLLPNPGVT
ncbi:hypothetical protein V5O48_012563, partial [Marasmius crinis-equi]